MPEDDLRGAAGCIAGIAFGVLFLALAALAVYGLTR
jgi:hypothetical protein